MIAADGRKRGRLARWLAPAALTAFIFATLPFMPTIREVAQRLAGLWLIRSLTAAALFAIALWCLHRLVFRFRIRAPGTFAKFALLGLAYVVFLASRSQSPIEQVHLLEYGLLGILVHRAIQLDRPGAAAYVLAVVLGSGIGYLDECVQGVIQHHWNAITGWIALSSGLAVEDVKAVFSRRFYDNRDISLNIVSVCLGQVALALFRQARALAPPAAGPRAPRA